MLSDQWVKSSYSSPNSDMCVEARRVADDSKYPFVSFTRAEWDAFVKDGKFDR
jgi:hypothetical protein